MNKHRTKVHKILMNTTFRAKTDSAGGLDGDDEENNTGGTGKTSCFTLYTNLSAAGFTPSQRFSHLILSEML